MRIKWETLKTKAIDATGVCGEYSFWQSGPYSLIAGIGDGSFDWKKNGKELRDKVVSIIDNWDIRRAKALIDLFPAIVPKNCQGRVPRCYMEDNENSDWMVEFE